MENYKPYLMIFFATVGPASLAFLGYLIWLADSGSVIAQDTLRFIAVGGGMLIILSCYMGISYLNNQQQLVLLEKQAEIDRKRSDQQANEEKERFINNAKENLMIAQMAAKTTETHARAQLSQQKLVAQTTQSGFLELPDKIDGLIIGE